MFRLRSVTVLSDVVVIFFRSITVSKSIKISKCMTKNSRTHLDHKTNTKTAQEVNTVGYATTNDPKTNSCYQ